MGREKFPLPTIPDIILFKVFKFCILFFGTKVFIHCRKTDFLNNHWANINICLFTHGAIYFESQEVRKVIFFNSGDRMQCLAYSREVPYH